MCKQAQLLCSQVTSAWGDNASMLLFAHFSTAGRRNATAHYFSSLQWILHSFTKNVTTVCFVWAQWLRIRPFLFWIWVVVVIRVCFIKASQSCFIYATFSDMETTQCASQRQRQHLKTFAYHHHHLNHHLISVDIHQDRHLTDSICVPSDDIYLKSKCVVLKNVCASNKLITTQVPQCNFKSTDNMSDWRPLGCQTVFLPIVSEYTRCRY